MEPDDTKKLIQEAKELAKKNRAGPFKMVKRMFGWILLFLGVVILGYLPFDILAERLLESSIAYLMGYFTSSIIFVIILLYFGSILTKEDRKNHISLYIILLIFFLFLGISGGLMDYSYYNDIAKIEPLPVPIFDAPSPPPSLLPIATPAPYYLGDEEDKYKPTAEQEAFFDNAVKMIDASNEADTYRNLYDTSYSEFLNVSDDCELDDNVCFSNAENVLSDCQNYNLKAEQYYREAKQYAIIAEEVAYDNLSREYSSLYIQYCESGIKIAQSHYLATECYIEAMRYYKYKNYLLGDKEVEEGGKYIDIANAEIGTFNDLIAKINVIGEEL